MNIDLKLLRWYNNFDKEEIFKINKGENTLP